MDSTVLDALDKVPLAEATWLLWQHTFPEAALNQFYDDHRGAAYAKVFTFAQLVHLIQDALCQHGGRARQTLTRLDGTDLCPASDQAFYGKLRRMPLPLSEAFLADGANRLRAWLPRRPYLQPPPSLSGYRIFLLDGKAFKHAAKRLKPVRGRAGRGLGGKALVALELSTGLLVGMAADADGHANEAKLVPRLLPALRPHLTGTRLWVADQQFGDLARVQRCTRDGDHCVLRLHPKSQFTPDPEQPARRDVDDRGRAWVDEVGTLHSRRQGSPRVRRITLERADHKPLVIVTDLLDADAFPTNDLLELYRQRWGIEQVFQKVSEVFHLNHLSGSSPQGIVFQGALCMTLYNLLQVVRGLVAEGQDRPAATVSTYQLWYDLNRELVALHTFVPAEPLLAALGERVASLSDLGAYVRQRLSAAWTERWAQSPPKKRHRPPNKHKRGTGGHFSIHRVLTQNQKK